MKLTCGIGMHTKHLQPPSGGCELQRTSACIDDVDADQTPSGGCELKLVTLIVMTRIILPAAFGRL